MGPSASDVPRLPDRWRDLGAFIRDQRNKARLSLRHLSELAGISNPYLSQIERGLRHPSAEILQQIAKALRISAETLYVQAGILEPGREHSDLARAIMADTSLTEDQKQALVRIYLSFRSERGPGGEGEAAPPGDAGPVARASDTALIVASGADIAGWSEGGSR
jgi:transcriptional regulator with XRE-family HTH domain